MKKPDAITIIRIEDFKEKVWPLAVDEMINIGRKTAKKLNKFNIFTLRDLANWYICNRRENGKEK